MNDQKNSEMTVDELIRGSRELREKLLRDPYRPQYHFATPEGSAMPFDPNGCIFWKGRYHMFYIFQEDNAEGERDHNWGHVSSIDLLHWHHHPTHLVGGMFSGNCFLNKDGIPTICHHKTSMNANVMAVAQDDELNTWHYHEANPITPETKEGDEHHDKYRSWDPCGFVDNDTYYAIFGGKRAAIAKSNTLEGPWEYCGDLMAHTIDDIAMDEDISCADLFPFGDKWILTCISHRLGCRAYIGEWKNEQFYPESHQHMSWADNGFFAPRVLHDDKGRHILWTWILDRRPAEDQKESGWSGTLSLPRELYPADDNSLRMRPIEELKRLRYNPQDLGSMTVAKNTEPSLESISGRSFEIELECKITDASQFGLKVCCSPSSGEETLIFYDIKSKQLTIDTTHSKTGDYEGPEVVESKAQKVESGPFALEGNETLKLRVFVDNSVVDVFANDRQAVMRRIYPSSDDAIQVSLFSKGADTEIVSLNAWDMAATNPY
jgi:beta-fructofuranosidase